MLTSLRIATSPTATLTRPSWTWGCAVAAGAAAQVRTAAAPSDAKHRLKRGIGSSLEERQSSNASELLLEERTPMTLGETLMSRQEAPLARTFTEHGNA